MVSLPIPLTTNYTPKVKKGDTVKVGDILAVRTTDSAKRIPIAQALRTSSKSAGKYLRVAPGDTVSEGDVLAVKKTFLKEEKVMTEVSGTVTAFERNTGDILITSQGDESEKEEHLSSPLTGTISACDDEQIVIDTDQDVLQGDDGIGGKAEAVLMSIDTDGESSASFKLDASIIGKILSAEVLDRESMVKAIGIGVEGIIVGKVDPEDLEYIVERQMRTPVVAFPAESWKKITKWVGKTVYLDGSTKTVVLLHV